MSWRYALAAVAGGRHIAEGASCQDDCRAQTAEFAGRAVWWAVASDGAGSAPAGAAGAAAVCRVMMAQIAAWLAAHAGAVEDLTPATVAGWLAHTVATIGEMAAAEQAETSAYAATLLAVVANDRATVAWQVGDGAIVAQLAPADATDVAEGGALRVVLWPNQGEYINTTHFVTDAEAAAQLRVERLPASRCLALLTDGLQQLALHYATRTAHTPFFAPLFARLAQAPPGASADLNRGLAAFLDSPAINQRTDDDKTLVLACTG